MADPGGFTDLPEVRKALNDMPQHPSPFALILRPAASLEVAMPFLGLALSADQRKSLQAYQRQLITNDASGWLTGGSDARGGDHYEAGGCLALVGTFAALAAAQEAMTKLSHSN